MRLRVNVLPHDQDMNASAILHKQGWRGQGHSLDHRDRGIKKPLLISHKQDLLGLGRKKPALNVGDQWWMRAFDESLRELGTGKQTTLGQVRQSTISRAGLYGFFIKGQGLQGTISPAVQLSEQASNIVTPHQETADTATSDFVLRGMSSDAMTDTERRGGSNKRKRQDEPITPTPKRIKPTEAKVVSETKQDKIKRKAENKKKIKVIKAERRQAKSVERQKKAKEAREAAKAGRTRADLAVTAITATDAFADGANEVRPDGEPELKKKERQYKTVPELKQEAKAKELGIEPEEHKARLAEQKRREQRQAKVAAKLAELSSEQLKDYTARAALKGQAIEDYIIRRIEKKAEKRADEDSRKARQTQSAPSQPVLVENPDDPANTIAIIPERFVGRPSGDLSKEERKARVLWKREGRLKKRQAKEAAGGKMAIRRALQQSLLDAEGKGGEGAATKEEIKTAWTKAGRILREEKKLKKKVTKGRAIGDATTLAKLKAKGKRGAKRSAKRSAPFSKAGMKQTS